jgi:alkylation response protein AidB-like acyl-CoA dehydrogenase
VRDGDHYVLNGTKSWVTHGTYDKLAVLTQVRTDTPDARRGSKGISTFVLTPDMPGFRVGKKENKLGLRASPTVQLVFEDLRVPAENLVGEEGQGFRYAMQSLDHGRLGIAAQALGIARAALVAARDYADQRKQFGQPIRNFQAIQFKLADMASRIASARALLFQTAAAKDRGERVTQYSSMAKLLASETSVFVADEAVQIFGGYGYVKEYPVERHLRDAKVTEIYEGTSEIQRVVIARELYA